MGGGRVRMGFVVDGMIVYAHEFLNSNVLDNSDGQWDIIDQDFEKDIPFYGDLECKEK